MECMNTAFTVCLWEGLKMYGDTRGLRLKEVAVCFILIVWFTVSASQECPAACRGLMREFGGISLGSSRSEVRGKVSGSLQEGRPEAALLLFAADYDKPETLELLELPLPAAVCSELQLVRLGAEADQGSSLRLGGVSFTVMRFVFMKDRLVYMELDAEPGTIEEALAAQLMSKYGNCKIGEVASAGGQETVHCFGDLKTSVLFCPLCAPWWLRGLPLGARVMIKIYDDQALEMIAEKILEHKKRAPGGTLIK